MVGPKVLCELLMQKFASQKNGGMCALKMQFLGKFHIAVFSLLRCCCVMLCLES